MSAQQSSQPHSKQLIPSQNSAAPPGYFGPSVSTSPVAFRQTSLQPASQVMPFSPVRQNTAPPTPSVIGTPDNSAKWMPFSSLLSAPLFRALLAIPALSSPTKIHHKVIPCILSGQEDILVQCDSPLESILCYGLPAITLCAQSPSSSAGVVGVHHRWYSL